MATDNHSNVKHPGGLLHVERTGRWHPIVFTAAPKPSENGERVCRHRSRSNHVAGFPSRDEAKAFLTDVWNCRDTGMVWKWDGLDFPAMTWYFDRLHGVATTDAASEPPQ